MIITLASLTYDLKDLPEPSKLDPCIAYIKIVTERAKTIEEKLLNLEPLEKEVFIPLTNVCKDLDTAEGEKK